MTRTTPQDAADPYTAANPAPSEQADGVRRRKTALDPKMMDLLVCPHTRGPLTYDEEARELVSPKARLAYPVRGGVPILLVSEARQLHEDELP